MATQTEIDNIWRTLGRLEEGQRRTEAVLTEVQAGLREVNRRVDRLFYAVITIGGALLVATLVGRFLDG